MPAHLDFALWQFALRQGWGNSLCLNSKTTGTFVMNLLVERKMASEWLASHPVGDHI